MRALKVATIVMGVLIVVGTMALVIALARRGSTPPPSGVPLAASTSSLEKPSASPVQSGLGLAATVVLDEPVGSRISGIAMVQDRLAVVLQGGGGDRVVLIDLRSGAPAGRILLAR